VGPYFVGEVDREIIGEIGRLAGIRPPRRRCAKVTRLLPASRLRLTGLGQSGNHARRIATCGSSSTLGAIRHAAGKDACAELRKSARNR